MSRDRFRDAPVDSVPLALFPKHIPLGIIVWVAIWEWEIAPQPSGKQIKPGLLHIRAAYGADVAFGPEEVERAVEDAKRREAQEREQRKAKRKFSRGAR